VFLLGCMAFQMSRPAKLGVTFDNIESKAVFCLSFADLRQMFHYRNSFGGNGIVGRLSGKGNLLKASCWLPDLDLNLMK